MKKLFFIFLFTFIFFGTPIAFTAESVTEDYDYWKNAMGAVQWELVKWTYTTATDGSLTQNRSNRAFHGYVTQAIVDPGTTVPDGDWKIRITDEDGCDIFNGTLDYLPINSTSQRSPSFSYTNASAAYVTTVKARRIDGYLYFDILDNNYSSTDGVVKVYIDKFLTPN